MQGAPRLPTYEWMGVLVLLALILVLAVSSFWTKHLSQFPSKIIQEPQVHVCVEGAVLNPGDYVLPEGSVLKNLLDAAGATVDSDIKKLNLKRKLIEGKLYTVPEIHWIYVNVQGAVKIPTQVKLRKGTRVFELIDLLALGEGANLQYLNKKRPLRDGETITIPTFKGRNQ